MRALALLLVLTGLTGCGPRAAWYEEQPSPSPKALRWNIDVMVGDPLTTTSADVREWHRASKRVVCRLGPVLPSDPDWERPVTEALSDRLRLCRDKGFDAVAFTAPTDSLVRQAATLRLPVLEEPASPAHLWQRGQ